MLSIAEQLSGLKPVLTGRDLTKANNTEDRHRQVYDYIVARAENLTSRDIQNGMNLSEYAVRESLRALKAEGKIVQWYSGRTNLYALRNPPKRRK